jgi:predicted enzyme related to lactoylglutathione lyase
MTRRPTLEGTVPSTVLPIIATRDLERALRFYTALLDAEQVERVPDEGPAFYVGLRVGDSELGLVAEDVASGAEHRGRILLSLAVDDVNRLLPRVEELGGAAPNPSNDMPWGQRAAHVADPDGNAVNLTQQL